MTLTPKKELQANKALTDRLGELMMSGEFRLAVHAALIEQVLAAPATTDPVISAAHDQQILGARAFILQLLNIAEQTKAVPQPLPTNLDHGVK
jgi:hypothetical protein